MSIDAKPNNTTASLVDFIHTELPGLSGFMMPMPDGMIDRNCLTYWFPKLVAAGLPVPRTEIVDAGPEYFRMLGIDGGPRDSEEYTTASNLVDAVAANIYRAAIVLNASEPFPVFLRTGQFSGKHDWKKTCYVADPAKLKDHVAHLVIMSELFGGFGPQLSWRYWCVRELLPTAPVARLPNYGGMPLACEFRGFIEGGKVVCAHSYWPERSIYEGFGKAKPWVSRIVQGSVFIENFVTSLHGLRRDCPNLSADGPAPTRSDCFNNAATIALNRDFFTQFNQIFGLPLFDAEIRKKQSTYIGSFFTADAPIKEWLATFAACGDYPGLGSTKGFKNNIDGSAMNLLDLNSRSHGNDPIRFLWSLCVDAERAVRVKDSGAIRENCLVVLHEIDCTDSNECRQMMMTVIPESWMNGFDVAKQAAAWTLSTEANQLFERVADTFRDDGAWSVDVLKTSRGYYVTDMAEAARSYHFEGCQHAGQFTGERS